MTNTISLIEYIDQLRKYTFDSEIFIFLMTTQVGYDKAIYLLQNLMGEHEYITIPDDFEIENEFIINSTVKLQVMSSSHFHQFCKDPLFELPEEVSALLIEETLPLHEVRSPQLVNVVKEIKRVIF